MKTIIHSKAIALPALVGALAVPAMAAAKPIPDVFERAAARSQPSLDVLERYAAAHPRGAHAQPAASPGYRFTTDTLGGNGHATSAPGYRLITDTLGGNGGPGLVSATPNDGFSWGDAGIGAGIAVGALALLTGSLALVRQLRHRPQTA